MRNGERVREEEAAGVDRGSRKGKNKVSKGVWIERRGGTS